MRPTADARGNAPDAPPGPDGGEAPETEAAWRRALTCLARCAVTLTGSDLALVDHDRREPPLTVPAEAQSPRGRPWLSEALVGAGGGASAP